MRLLRLSLVAFSAGLGVMVALRLGTEAMAVVVGVLLGVLAGLPVAVLVLYAARRRAETDDTPATAPADVTSHPTALPATAFPAAPQPPQIIVVSAPPAQAHAAPQWWGQAAMPAPAPRDFHIVGDDD